MVKRRLLWVKIDHSYWLLASKPVHEIEADSDIHMSTTLFDVHAPHLSRWQNVVHVLKEGLFFDFVVSEEEAEAFSKQACSLVQTF